jgi:hypothetical protein
MRKSATEWRAPGKDQSVLQQLVERDRQVAHPLPVALNTA